MSFVTCMIHHTARMTKDGHGQRQYLVRLRHLNDANRDDGVPRK